MKNCAKDIKQTELIRIVELKNLQMIMGSWLSMGQNCNRTVTDKSNDSKIRQQKEHYLS